MEIEYIKPGDIIVCNRNDARDKDVIRPAWLSEYDPSDYTAIAVVVIPPTFKNNIGRAVSLCSLDTKSIPNGCYVNGKKVKWSHNCKPAPTTERSKIPTIGDPHSQSDNIMLKEMGYIPTDCFKGPECAANPKYRYYSDNVKQCIATPFIDGYKSNPKFTLYMAMYGEQDTLALINSTTKNNVYPAAESAYKLSTIGDTQYEWYLPSIGELCCMVTNIGAINHSIEKVQEHFGVGLKLESGEYWSSTQAFPGMAWVVDTRNGLVHMLGRPNYLNARAFIKF